MIPFLESLSLNQGAFNNADDLQPNVFERHGVNIDAVKSACGLRQSYVFMQPLRKIVRHELNPKARLDEVVVNRMHAHLANAFGEFVHGVSNKAGWENDNVGSTKIKRFLSYPLTDN